MSRKANPDRARRVAYEVFRAVDERDVYTNLMLPHEIEKFDLDERDVAFATELTFGALRWKLQNQEVAAQCVDRDWTKLDAPIRDLLVLGVHQLHHMRVPTHAAVSATVELARAVVGEGRASLVNAVLRKVAAQSFEVWLQTLSQLHNQEEVLASHPQWIINAYRDARGPDGDIEGLLEANNTPPRVCLVARSTAVEDLVAMGGEPGALSPFAVYWSGSLSSLRGLGTPALGVQDEGSQLVTLAATRVPVEDEKQWLDLCAGPGGKAALLSAIASDRGDIRLVANEPQEHRAELVRRVVGSNTTVEVGDGRSISGAFDRTVIDAPCSGIGALRRRPEARWRRKPRDIGALVPLQRDLLRSGIEATKSGGVIAYITCSPHIAETRGVVEQVLEGRQDVELLRAGDYLPEVPDASNGSYVQLWPDRHGTDAMFLALIRRTAR